MLKITNIIYDEYPTEYRSLLDGARLYDSSCSPEARVLFIDKDSGYFLKSAPKGKLEREAAMTRYFHSKGLSPGVLSYRSDDRDWMLTARVRGDDCTAARYLEQPERLCDTVAEQLARLHAEDFSGCPVQDHTERYLAGAERNRLAGAYDKSHFPDSLGYKSEEDAWKAVEAGGRSLKNNTLLHGDYCLPNLLLDDWRFSGFIDLDSGGVGDRHVDLFWGIWSLGFNLKTDKYRERFIDAYGRGNVDTEMLRVVAAIEVFG